jgi:hypothetical protein
MSFRRFLVLMAALVLVAAAAYTAYWFHVAGQLRKGIEGWAEQRRAQGWQVAWSDLSVGGFPLTVTARVVAPALTSPAGLHWDTGAVAASANPFDITKVHLTAPGRHTLTGLTLEAGGAEGDLDMAADGRLEIANAALSNVKAEMPGFEPVTAAVVALVLDPLPDADAGPDSPSYSFSATAQDVVLPPLAGLVLDRAIAVAEVSGQVKGRVPPGSPLAALAEWSANGGTVDIDRLVLDWAPMGLEADGTIAFDPAMQPLAALSARVRGFGPLMDRLAEAGAVDPGAANAAKLLLTMMAKSDPRGRPVIPVPVTLQDGILYLGPAKVARVPPVDWPEN